MSKAIRRAVKILDLLAEEGPQRFTQIVKNLGLSKSSTHDILSTMEAENLVLKDPDERRYFLGTRLMKLARESQPNVDLKRAAAKALEELRTAFDETVFLAILENDRQIIIDFRESSQALRTGVSPGTRDYLYYTSLGKAMMAFMRDERIEMITARCKLEKRTENTIVDTVAFKEELKKIRERGYAVDNMEHSDWVRCVGAAIRNHSGDVFAAISVSGPPNRLKLQDIPTIGKLVREKADEISKKLGYRSQTHVVGRY